MVDCLQVSPIEEEESFEVNTAAPIEKLTADARMLQQHIAPLLNKADSELLASIIKQMGSEDLYRSDIAAQVIAIPSPLIRTPSRLD